MARASAASSGFGISFSENSRRTISWTCFLSAPPYPVMAIFTCIGVCSEIGMPPSRSVSRVTPRASLTVIAVLTFFWKNSFSTPTSAGLCSSMSPFSASWSEDRRSTCGISFGVSRQPCATWRNFEPSLRSSPKPTRAVPGSMPRMITGVRLEVGVGVDVLHVLVGVERLEEFRERGLLVFRDLQGILGDIGRLGRSDLEPGLLDLRADVDEVGERGDDFPALIVARDVLRAGFDERHLRFIGILAFEFGEGDLDHAAALEHPGDGSRRAERPAVAGEGGLHVRGRAVAVVGDAFDQDGGAAGSVSFIQELDEDFGFQLPRAALDGAFDVVLRHEGLLGLLDGGVELRVHGRVSPLLLRRHGDGAAELGEFRGPLRVGFPLSELDVLPVASHIYGVIATVHFVILSVAKRSRRIYFRKQIPRLRSG